MLSQKYKFIFIHIPKTGGNSIQNVLRNYSEDEIVVRGGQDGYERFEVQNPALKTVKHSTLDAYYRALTTIDSKRIDDFFKFCCVRNPWARAISFYFSPHRGMVTWNRSAFIQFVKSMKQLACMEFICTEGSVKVDYVMRLERIQDDFNDVCDKIGIDRVQLPYVNRSSHRHYSEYYDEETVELVAETWQRDIDYFGYKFGRDF